MPASERQPCLGLADDAAAFDSTMIVWSWKAPGLDSVV
jgi:hypothetical protein